MFELELIVMFVGLRPEANFLYFYLYLLSLHLLLALLLLIKELGVVDKTTYRRIGGRRNLHKVNLLVAGHFQCLTGGYDDAAIVAHDTHLTHTNLLINAVLAFHFVVLHKLLFTKSAAKVRISAEFAKQIAFFFSCLRKYSIFSAFILYFVTTAKNMHKKFANVQERKYLCTKF